ncbi:MAG: type IVB secretion system protein IcmH/DotU [Legionellales bacterium]|nr:type IVB secretion system protein IcmH/DotU [Legionellales bacterium]
MEHHETSSTWLRHHPATDEAEFDFAYYRPLTFSAKQGINPLVTAANPLLSLASQLHLQTHYHDIHQLHADLVHEIRAFSTRAKQLNIKSETIQVARYVICALFDEIILQSAWGNETLWGKYRLLATFKHDAEADERFYTILNRLCQDAVIYIDIIELMYLSLSVGFFGKYRFAEQGVAKRSELMDKLYHLIRMQRGEFSQNLSLPPPAQHCLKQRKPFSPLRNLLITASLLIILCVGFNVMIQVSSAPLQQHLQQIINRNTL